MASTRASARERNADVVRVRASDADGVDRTRGSWGAGGGANARAD